MAALTLKQLWEVEDYESLTNEDKVRLLRHRRWQSLVTEPDNAAHRRELTDTIAHLKEEAGIE